MMEAGSVYTIKATLRNDGATPWRKADGTRVTLRLYRLTDGAASRQAKARCARCIDPQISQIPGLFRRGLGFGRVSAA